MSCEPCGKKKQQAEAPTEDIPMSRLGITCYCGLARLLPQGLKVGDKVTLVPCPKCGQGFSGVMVEGGVET